ncbi:MAG TPA: TonB-dependent receptor [Steroidobacteraceae bacterium]|nr:TonB-dependent receptor [Steroidobacteraceae bacterium]
MKFPKAVACGGAVLGIFLSTSMSVFAATDELEEVVITAGKRKENLQDVPIAVTAVSGDAFNDANVSGFSEVAKFAPSLTVTAGDQPANNAIVVRGVGTFAFSIAAEPSVLVVVDDAPVGYQAQAFTDLVDIDRVEVLNGPQSTLFGKSASAGVINVVTKDPTGTFTYFGDVKVTNDNEQRATLSLSGPISDTLSYRVSGNYRHWDGNVKNLVNNSKIDNDNAGGIRAKVQWRPNDDMTAQFTLHHSQDHSNCCGVPLVRLDSGATLFGQAALPQAVAIPGVVPGPENDEVSIDQVPQAYSEDTGFTSHITYDTDKVIFLSVSAIDQYHLRDLTDYDTSAVDTLQYFTPFNNTQPVGSRPVSTGQLHGGLLQGGSFKVKTFTQEFRLSSNGKQNFNYVAGAYFSSENLVRAFGRGFVGNTKAIANWRGETQYQNYALYGQTSWLFLPRTTLITGLRFNREESSYAYDDYYRVVHFSAVGNPTSDVDNVTTGKLGLQYQISDDMMVFAFAAKGYKGVAYDLVTGLSAVEAASFPVRAEKSNDYEVGLRSEWFEHRMLFNATVYHTEYSDFQVQTIVPTILNSFILTNIPKVRTRGVELETAAQMTERLHISVSYAYTDARAIEYPIGQCYSGQVLPTTCALSPGYQDLAGATLPNAPKNKVTASLEYKQKFSALPVDASLKLSSVWQSAEFFSITKDPGTRQPAYGVTNLNLELTPQQHDRFSISLFCNNLFDKHYAANLTNVRGNWGFPSAAGTAYTQVLPRDFSRYFGIRLAIQSH